MQNFLITLLEIAPTQKDASFGERLSYGGEMLVVGIGIVFSVLILLWLSLELFSLISQRLNSKEAAAPVVTAPAPKAKVEEVKTPDDLELIAVLTAAIAASESAPAARFRVVSFKRK